MVAGAPDSDKLGDRTGREGSDRARIAKEEQSNRARGAKEPLLTEEEARDYPLGRRGRKDGELSCAKSR